MNGNQRRMKVVGSLLLIIAIFTAVAASVWGGDKKSGGSSDSTTTTSAPADEGNVPNEVIAVLTVTSTSTSCTDNRHGPVTEFSDAKLVSFEIGALKAVQQNGRLWSDALSTPLKGDTDLERLRSLETAICRDPLLGVTVANLFANMSVGRVKVVDLNDWLKPYQGHARRVNDRAARFIPLMDEEDPSDTDVATAMTANRRYQDLAEKLNTLIGRFAVGGVKAEKSVLNYHLVGGGLVAGGLPEVGLNPRQEQLPALTLELTTKGACVPLKVIGFNVFDKRPEVFSVPRCVDTPSTTPTTTGGGTTPTTRPGSTTTTTVGTTTTTCPTGKCVPPTTTPTSPPNTGLTTPSTRPTPTTNPPTTVETAHPPPPTTLAPAPLTCEQLEAQGLPLPPRCLQ